jgi:hypothetical protein
LRLDQILITCSVMAQAALLAREVFASLKTAEQVRAELDSLASAGVLPLGLPALDEVLPRGGLDFGSVIELRVCGASGAATSFALAACRAAQYLASRYSEGGNCFPDNCFPEPGPRSPNWGAGGRSASGWCAFIDPSASLFAPGVAQLGVDLERLLVVRPDLGSAERVAVRIAESKVCSVVVIDLRGVLGELSVDNRRWQRTIRRLSLAIKPLCTCILVLTHTEGLSAHVEPIVPLPVALRLEFSRSSSENFELKVAKERSGRVGQPRAVPWSVFRMAPFSERHRSGRLEFSEPRSFSNSFAAHQERAEPLRIPGLSA